MQGSSTPANSATPPLQNMQGTLANIAAELNSRTKLTELKIDDDDARARELPSSPPPAPTTAPDPTPTADTLQEEALLEPYVSLLTYNEIYGAACVELAAAARAAALPKADMQLVILYGRRQENARKIDNWRGWLVQAVRNSGWPSVVQAARAVMEPKRAPRGTPSASQKPAPVIYGTLPDPPPIPNHIKLLTPEERRAIRRRAFEEVGHALTD